MEVSPECVALSGVRRREAGGERTQAEEMKSMDQLERQSIAREIDWCRDLMRILLLYFDARSRIRDLEEENASLRRRLAAPE